MPNHICCRPELPYEVERGWEGFSRGSARPQPGVSIPQPVLMCCSIPFSVILTSNKTSFNLQYKIDFGLEKHNKQLLMNKCLLDFSSAFYGYEYLIASL